MIKAKVSSCNLDSEGRYYPVGFSVMGNKCRENKGRQQCQSKLGECLKRVA